MCVEVLTRLRGGGASLHDVTFLEKVQFLLGNVRVRLPLRRHQHRHAAARPQLRKPREAIHKHWAENTVSTANLIYSYNRHLRHRIPRM